MNIDLVRLHTIGPESIGQGPVRPGPAPQIEGKSFKDLLIDKVKEVDDLIAQKNKAIEELALGRTHNAAAVSAAVQKADIAFEYMMQIRARLIDAYMELNQMQL